MITFIICVCFNFDSNAVIAIATAGLAVLTFVYVRLTNKILQQNTKASEAQARPYFDLSKPDSTMVNVLPFIARVYMANHGGNAYNVFCESLAPEIRTTVEYPIRNSVLSKENFNFRLTKSTPEGITASDLLGNAIEVKLYFQDVYEIKYVQLVTISGTGYKVNIPTKHSH